MRLIERIVEKVDILKENLPKGILTRVRYPIMRFGIKNANKRIYEKEVAEKIINDPVIQEKLKTRTLFGDAEHPVETQIKLNKDATSHIISDLYIGEDKNKSGQLKEIKLEDNVLYADLDILPTEAGKFINVLFEAGCLVGVSTRADGGLEEKVDESGEKYHRVIPEEYVFSTTDFTGDPSTPEALPENIQKNVLEIVQKEYASKELSKETAVALLEKVNTEEAKILETKIKEDKQHFDCECQLGEKKCSGGCNHDLKIGPGSLVKIDERNGVVLHVFPKTKKVVVQLGSDKVTKNLSECKLVEEKINETLGRVCDNCKFPLEEKDYSNPGSWSYTCPKCGFYYNHADYKSVDEQVKAFNNIKMQEGKFKEIDIEIQDLLKEGKSDKEIVQEIMAKFPVSMQEILTVLNKYSKNESKLEEKVQELEKRLNEIQFFSETGKPGDKSGVQNKTIHWETDKYGFDVNLWIEKNVEGDIIDKGIKDIQVYDEKGPVALTPTLQAEVKKYIEDLELKESKIWEIYGIPKTDEERAQTHFSISKEEWVKLPKEKQNEYISKLPPRGTGMTETVELKIEIPPKVEEFLSTNWGIFATENEGLLKLREKFPEVKDTEALKYLKAMETGKGKIGTAAFVMESKEDILLNSIKKRARILELKIKRLENSKNKKEESYINEIIKLSEKIQEKEKYVVEIIAEKIILGNEKRMLQEQANKKADQLMGIIEEKEKEIDKLQKIKESLDKRHKEDIKLLNENFEIEKQKLEEKHQKELVKKYFETKINTMGLILPKLTQTLFENCNSEEEVDNLIKVVQQSLSESILHFNVPAKMIVESSAKTDPAMCKFEDAVGSALHGMGIINKNS